MNPWRTLLRWLSAHRHRRNRLLIATHRVPLDDRCSVQRHWREMGKT